jgi:hypothetical protein
VSWVLLKGWIPYFNPWLKYFSSSTISDDGMSWVLLIGWIPYFKVVYTSLVHSSIAGKLKYKNFFFLVINIYGPYANKIPFWEELKFAGIFSDLVSVIRGYLNFTLPLREVLGYNPREDRQSGFFLFFIKEARLVYLEPIKLSPT